MHLFHRELHLRRLFEAVEGNQIQTTSSATHATDDYDLLISQTIGSDN